MWHLRDHVVELRGLPPVTQTQLYDLLMYLPNDMLVKVDRASMANSLNAPVPFLSRCVAELARFRFPNRSGTTSTDKLCEDWSRGALATNLPTAANRASRSRCASG